MQLQATVAEPMGQAAISTLIPTEQAAAKAQTQTRQVIPRQLNTWLGGDNRFGVLIPWGEAAWFSGRESGSRDSGGAVSVGGACHFEVNGLDLDNVRADDGIGRIGGDGVEGENGDRAYE